MKQLSNGKEGPMSPMLILVIKDIITNLIH